ncbi:hypothetical protein SVIOM342S_04627 [Streptomyces violaceorubidus]
MLGPRGRSALRKAKRLESAGTRVEGECISHYWPSGGYVGAVCAVCTYHRAMWAAAVTGLLFTL